MKGRASHSEAAERKHGGHVHKKEHHGKKHADGGLAHNAPFKSDEHSEVFEEAKGKDAGGHGKAGKNIGQIGGVKSKPRADRKRGGHVSHTGAPKPHHAKTHHHKEHHASGGHAGHDGMPTIHHGHTGGVTAHHLAAGGESHAGKGGADMSPYSSVHGALTRRKGGHCG